MRVVSLCCTTLLGLGIAAVSTSCTGDQAIAPYNGRRAHATLVESISRCRRACILADDIRPFRAAAVGSDTANAVVDLATVSLVGDTGDSVSARLIADGQFFTSAIERQLVTIRVKGAAEQYTYEQLKTAIVLYRFLRPDTITIEYGLVRSRIDQVQGSVRMEQSVSRTVRVISARTPWVRASVASLAQVASGSGITTQVRCAVPGPSSTYCGVDVAFNPYFVGSPFGEFQNPEGTGASAPITITFSPAVDNIAVSIADPDFPGNRLTVHTTAGANNTYDFVGDGTPGAYTEYEIITGDIGVTSIDLTPAPNDYVAYFGLSFTTGDSIVVTCSPSSVQRGGSIACTAKSSDSVRALQVDSWRFVGSPHSRIQIDSVTQSTSWSGTLVTSGEISVVGSIAGARGVGSTNVTAKPRDWATMLPRILDPLYLGTDNLPAHPTRVGQLGNTDFLDNIATFNDGDFTQAPSGGPNGGVYYVLRVPFTAQPRIRVDTVALSVGSDFYNLQRPNGGNGTCGKSDVVPFIPVVKAHEGINFESNSHTNFYRAKANKISGPLMEGIVGRTLSDLQNEGDSVVGIIRNAAHDSSDWADSTGFAPQYCTFKYFKP